MKRTSINMKMLFYLIVKLYFDFCKLQPIYNTYNWANTFFKELVKTLKGYCKKNL